MWSLITPFLFIAAVAAALTGSVSAQTYEEQLSENYTVRWTPNYDLQRVTFQVIVRTKSYVGFGISPTGRMLGGDVVIGGVFADGRIYFEDNYVNEGPGSTPQRDPSQDYSITYAQENGTHTELHFYRAFDTGDATHDHVIDGEPTYFIYAIGGYDPVVPDDIIIHHGPLRGSRAVTILDPALLPPRDPCVPRPVQHKEAQLSEDVHVRWMADLRSETVEFYVTVTLPEGLNLAPGYIGLGFAEPDDAGAGASAGEVDTFFGGRHVNGSSRFGDYFSSASEGVHAPQRDLIQNYSPLGLVTSNGTHAEFSFLRGFNTGDELHDYNPITDRPVELVWSIGEGVDFGATAAAAKVVTGQMTTRLLDVVPEDCKK